MPGPHRQIAELKRLQHFKQTAPPPDGRIGTEMIRFFKQTIQKRQTRLGAIAESWSALVPPMFNDHCSLESLNRGTLTVLVDNASHLYELKQLLLAGLQQQLLVACRSAGLRKITLRPGRWYDGEPADRKPRFDR